jgi:nitrite reductase (NADH) small subunit/3-phenylpropionate/trans-cinnamate dioxygenase ferredoxin subunit
VSNLSFHTVAKVGEIPEGQGAPFEVDGRMIAVFHEGGEYYALDDSCPHQGAPLSEGIVYDRSVTCTWHGWRFGLADGKWLDSPRSKTCVRTYPVRVEGDEVQVGIE